MERDHGRGTGVISNQLSGILAQPLQPSSRRHEKTQPEAGDMKLSEDFSAIYLLQSPLLYFRSALLPIDWSHSLTSLRHRAVEVAIVLNSLYLSLWLINFITVCARVTDSPRWQLVM